MKYIQLFNRCSHNHKISNVGCLIYIRLAEQLIKGLNIRDALSAAVNAIDSQYKIPEYQRIWDLSILNTKENDISSSGYVVDTLEAAIWCCHNASSYKEAVLSAVNLGNDTDTIAALTGFLAGICYKDIPAEWKSNIRDKETIERLCQNFQSTLVHDS